MTERPQRESLPDAEERIHALTPSKKAGRRVGPAVFLALLLVGLVLKFTPWQQTIIGNGKVGVFGAMDRPQTIDAQIGGRLRQWLVQEGQSVEKGQLLAVIEDTDSSFLSPERLSQVEKRLVAQRQRRTEETARVARLKERIQNLSLSQPQQLAIARRQKEQAENAARIAGQQVKLALNGVDAARNVAQAQAAQRLAQARIGVEQAQDRAAQAEQLVTEDENSLKFQTFQTKRIVELADGGLRSGRDKELEQNRQVGAQQKLARSKKALEIARKDIERARQEVKVIAAANVLADIDVQRAVNQLSAQQSALLNAQQAIAIAESNILRVESDSSAPVRQAEADLNSVQAGLAQIDDAITLAEQQRDNMKARVGQQKIYAPQSGRIARLGKTVGSGQTIKKDDALCEIVPATKDQAVALMVGEADASLVRVGRRVRLQFNGFPAVQVSGFPQAAVGTFAGVVTSVDPDGTSKGVRVWIAPDDTKKEKPWPPAKLLRPGTGAVGWVLLEKVPLWYELWRQFNAFPPEYNDDSSAPKPMKDGDVKIPKRG
jgi:membrane fusion protein, adhesin transport system